MQNRRILDGIFRSVGATPKAAVETNSIFNLVSHVASGPWSAIVPRQLLQFFGIPANTRAIELVEPVTRRAIGYIAAERSPLTPLARNLLGDADSRRHHGADPAAAAARGLIGAAYRLFANINWNLSKKRKINVEVRQSREAAGRWEQRL